ILSSAFETAVSGAPGPVVIEVPEEIWKTEGEGDQPFAFDPLAPVVAVPAQTEKIVRALVSARKPLILAGGGIRTVQDAALLKTWAELTGIPVVTTGNGRGALSEKHPLCFGRVGFGGGTCPADEAFCQCDVLVTVGCGVSDMVTYEYTQSTSADIFVISYGNPSPKIFPEEHLCCDAGSALKLLISQSSRSFGPYTEWKNILESKCREWNEQLDGAASRESTGLNPSFFFRELGKALPQDAKVCGGAGLHVVYANDYLPALNPRSFLAAVNFGSMGFGLPAAMAAGFIYPGRKVVAVLGDGEFLMTLQDLETVVREKIAPVLIVVNDSSYRVLEMKQRIGSGRIIGTRHGNPDFMKTAEAFGLKGIRVASKTDVAPAISSILSSAGPLLVELKVDPEDLPPTNLAAAMRMGQS
ncbi:MAG: thiamine pyrophosphate-binding protein, partial [Deltaproteobacteria bacterium]|nr:thiamine pyrophosphate-binding protein [Deltaproteobacteria bacterium]